MALVFLLSVLFVIIYFKHKQRVETSAQLLETTEIKIDEQKLMSCSLVELKEYIQVTNIRFLQKEISNEEMVTILNVLDRREQLAKYRLDYATEFMKIQNKDFNKKLQDIRQFMKSCHKGHKIIRKNKKWQKLEDIIQEFTESQQPMAFMKFVTDDSGTTYFNEYYELLIKFSNELTETQNQKARFLTEVLANSYIAYSKSIRAVIDLKNETEGLMQLKSSDLVLQCMRLYVNEV